MCLNNRCYHYFLKYGKKQSNNRIVSIDTEWCKNWTAKEKFVPFSLAVHSIYLDDKLCNNNLKLDINELYMETELYFRKDEQTTDEYILSVQNIIQKYMDTSTIIIGHQFSSDLHTLKNCTKNHLPAIESLINSFQHRKNNDKKPSQLVADTRYDIRNRILGEEKLRTVSLRLNIFAVQNELDKMSLTKMYNLYLNDKDIEKREMLLIMNWRHAFQTNLIWLVDTIYCNNELYNKNFGKGFLITNDIMFEMGKKDFKYINSYNFTKTLSLENILKYVKTYYPQNKYVQNYILNTN